MPEDQRPPTTDALTPSALSASGPPDPAKRRRSRFVQILTDGDIELQGRLPWSSNGAFLAVARQGDEAVPCIYKPHCGERPLWDFPDGLYLREVAAYEVADALGWHLVPETVLRQDGPTGPGSLQRFVEADFAEHYFTLLEASQRHPELLRMAVFDLTVNNADRKSGHCLLAEDQIWGIDNGLCFHAEPKLRTVIWEFAGDSIPASLRTDLARLAAQPPPSLTDLLSDLEIEVLCRRARAVAELDCLPDPVPERRPYPWPLV